MACDLTALIVDAGEPDRLEEFWRELLADADLGFSLRFVRSGEPKTVPNQMHFDLTSTSRADQRARVERALGLGARHLDIGQRPEEGHVVLADPEGNELCVIESGNRFLSDTGVVGALASDGTQAVGYFWSAALEWPLVWDEGEETAIQSPSGGLKITWGGPPLAPRAARSRWRYELAPRDGDLPAELDRLVALGASLIERTDDRAVCADPDGTEFSVVSGLAQE